MVNEWLKHQKYVYRVLNKLITQSINQGEDLVDIRMDTSLTVLYKTVNHEANTPSADIILHKNKESFKVLHTIYIII